MKFKNLSSMLETEIVDEFIQICIVQSEAAINDNFSLYKKIYNRVIEIANELGARPGDRRAALLPLLEHENIQVRMMAAGKTLAIAPTAARRALENISASNWYPFAADARSTLRAFNSGMFTRE